MTPRSVFLSLAAVAIGCTPTDRPASPTQSDSLGVSVIEYAVGFDVSPGNTWSTDPDPLLSIGGTATALYRVRNAVFQSDGTVVVANGGSYELLLFDSAGQVLSRTGGEGGGPGEFHHLTFLSVGPADSLFAYDRRERRLSVFDRNGVFAHAVTLSGLDGLGTVEQIGVLRSGEIVGAFHQRTRGVGLVRDSLVVVIFGRSGAMTASLGAFPHMYTHWGPHPVPEGDGRAAFPLPVAFSSLTAVGVRDTVIYVGLADDFSLIRMDGSGKRRVTRQKDTPALVTDTHREQLFAVLAEHGMNGRELEVLRALRGPLTLPAFGHEPLTARVDEQVLLVTDTEGVWVKPFELPPAVNTRWLRFDAHGLYEGTITMPVRFRPTAVRGDVVLGVYRDATDVEYVRAYRVVADR